jgi:alkyl sulfatase BDS1-like metallo-beta-lactamase superfamily hydrolase
VKLGMLFTCLFLSLCAQSLAQEPSEETQRLLERNQMFEPQIIQVADNVYAALGYQVSTSAMIVGDDGIIIVDPGIVTSSTQNVHDLFREITSKPVKAIIYTHGHADHTNGANVYYEAGVQVWARSNYGSESDLVLQNGYAGGVRPSNTQGFDLPFEQRIGIGVGIPPRNRPNLGTTLMADGNDAADTGNETSAQLMLIEPTHTFASDRFVLNVAGVELELVKAPGETADQLYVWYPEKGVLFAGDNFYQSWPNTYPLRGTARRSIRDWISSINSMVEEQPACVVPGHTGPMSNATTVLTNYRDALQWVLDRTIEGARNKLSPDELVEYTQLPAHLADLDYLQDYYGSRWGTVRDIYAQDLGWFDGNVLNLHRESPVEQAQRITDLLGGIEALAAKTREALLAGDYLGAAQLSDAWTTLEADNPEAWSILADALSVIAERTFNAPARNYTFSSANSARRMAETFAE